MIQRNKKILVLLSTIGFAFVASATLWASDRDSKVARIGNDIKVLSSDDMEGRGPGTDGLEKAAHFIRDRFKELGLKGAGTDGAYMRPFEFAIGSRPVKEKTYVILRGPPANG